MSFLGLFKSKREKEVEKIRAEMFSQVFPNGNEQMEKEIGEVNELLGGKYPNDQIRAMYIHIVFLFFIAQDKSEERIVESAMFKANDKILKEDIVKVYNYVKNKILKQQLGIEDQSELDEISNGIFGGNEGCDSNEIPGSYGDYGYSPTNPIPTKGIIGSNAYLSKLRLLADNKEIKWERAGSCSSENIENMIDQYKLSDVSENFIATIYISPYHKKNSDKAPVGFILY